MVENGFRSTLAFSQTSLSDPYTGQFLNSWNNTLTGKVNEVRPVANDPVNYKDSGRGQLYAHSRTNPEKFVSNSPIFLQVKIKLGVRTYSLFQYPNPLADSSYDDYCGFEDYYAAEIYGAFFDGCQAIDNFEDKIHEVDAINAWSRIRYGIGSKIGQSKSQNS